MRLSGILLAAGRGVRFGGDKLIEHLGNRAPGAAANTPLAVAAYRNLAGAIPDVVAVVRSRDDAVARLLADAGATVIECPRADEGMGASLACGVFARADGDGWIVALGDMPWIAPTTIVAVAEALRRGASIAAPSHHGARGHPVGFAARHRDALLGLAGDEGARALLRTPHAEITLLDVEDPGVLRDVDTRADLASGSDF